MEKKYACTTERLDNTSWLEEKYFFLIHQNLIFISYVKNAWPCFSDTGKAEFLNAVLLSVFCSLQIELMILKCHTIDVFAAGDHPQHSIVTANLHLG